MSRLPLVAALAFLASSAAYLVAALRLSPGSVEQPGPGLFPVAVGLLLVASSSAFVFQSLRASSAAAAGPPAEAGKRVTGVLAVLAAFCLFLPWLGYAVTAPGLLVVILRLFGLARWPVVAALAVVATAASYYLFGVLLGVPLPAGVWTR
ncbi:MAG: tripartite tricarboxylate transporter TctB family protein [Candidatus Rokubacteria bacterium]|nr:tripartite tricarboxylate transporter TctB family protein [Candidatus Rokubacteria bacterium]